MNEIAKERQELQEALGVAHKFKLKRKIIFLAIVAALILVCVVIVYISGYNTAKNKLESRIAELNQYIDEIENTPVVVEPVTPEIIQKVLSGKTEEISELATAEYLFTNAARFTDTAHIVKMFDWMTKKSFVQKWDGTIKAGVKLNELQITIENKTITIIMPHAEILSYEINYESVEVLDEKNNIFNPISVNDKANFDKETKAAMIERAKENGLLEKAQENAKSTIASLLTASVENIQEYKIQFEVTGE